MRDITQRPILSLNVVTQLQNVNIDEALDIARKGKWFFSHRTSQFVSYVPEWDVNVTQHIIEALDIPEEEIHFNLPPYSSVYELTRTNGYSTSLLLASQLASLVEKHLDVTEDLEIIMVNKLSAPVLLGNKKVVERLTLGIPRNTYFRTNLNDFIKGRETHV